MKRPTWFYEALAVGWIIFGFIVAVTGDGQMVSYVACSLLCAVLGRLDRAGLR